MANATFAQADIVAALVGTSDDAVVLERLARFVALLLDRNAAMNLTAARTPAAVAEHVRDALTLLPHVVSPLVDVGSGGGFPAIPLAIAAGVEATLVESTGKKARFLSEVVAELELPAAVVATRAEDAARRPDLRATFAAATARAVGSVPTVLELTVPFLRVGGVALLQRGRFEPHERSAAHDAALVLGVVLEAEVPAPGGEDRRLLVFRKQVATGQRFPRRAGIPAQRPLCVTE